MFKRGISLKRRVGQQTGDGFDSLFWQQTWYEKGEDKGRLFLEEMILTPFGILVIRLRRSRRWGCRCLGSWLLEQLSATSRGGAFVPPILTSFYYFLSSLILHWSVTSYCLFIIELFSFLRNTIQTIFYQISTTWRGHPSSVLVFSYTWAMGSVKYLFRIQLHPAQKKLAY